MLVRRWLGGRLTLAVGHQERALHPLGARSIARSGYTTPLLLSDSRERLPFAHVYGSHAGQRQGSTRASDDAGPFRTQLLLTPSSHILPWRIPCAATRLERTMGLRKRASHTGCAIRPCLLFTGQRRFLGRIEPLGCNDDGVVLSVTCTRQTSPRSPETAQVRAHMAVADVPCSCVL